MGTGRAIIGAVGLLAACGAARAEERLVLGPPPGGPWHDVINRSTDRGFVRQQMPEGQTPEAFRDVLTSQAIRGYRGGASEFMSLAFSKLAETCATSQTVGPTMADEQGRQVAYGRFYCGQQKGQTYGAHMFFKVIKGNEALYVVERNFRIPPTGNPSSPSLPENEVVGFLQSEGAARKYLTDKVYLCDPAFPDPKCASEAVPTGR
jgi:hypothetical protein